MSQKKTLELVILSDLHLGTYGCSSKELLLYLKSIRPETLILNGDIIDIWQFNKYFWPKSHAAIIKEIISLLSSGTKVIYITGNHDEMMRRYSGLKLGKFEILDKLVMPLSNGERAWIFHGDVFDVMMEHSKFLTRLGAYGYEILILINSLVNRITKLLGRSPVSLASKVKGSVKSAVKYLNKFENLVAEIGSRKGYDYVVCGHIHKPEKRKYTTEYGEITYLNSGDWIENLSALEFDGREWKIYRFKDDPFITEIPEETHLSPSYQQIFDSLKKDIAEINIKGTGLSTPSFF
ncbi:MAG: UDP-2,3-diacylglucosamine diphosphatase [Bacteroidales bacterium]|nr:UDP-2,3-diacylglucosamine diphosphatase [Bacteroidales bacterium]